MKEIGGLKVLRQRILKNAVFLGAENVILCYPVSDVKYVVNIIRAIIYIHKFKNDSGDVSGSYLFFVRDIFYIIRHIHYKTEWRNCNGIYR